jgi:hypothetical protein
MTFGENMESGPAMTAHGWFSGPDKTRNLNLKLGKAGNES